MNPFEHNIILQINHVSLSYGNKVILRDVNAIIRDIVRPDCVTGQVVGFLGPSGMGKTQLSRIIAGLNKPTSGEVLINQHATPVHAGEVGVVAQNYPLFKNRTVLSNMLLAAGRKEKNSKIAREKALDFIEQFGLTERAMLYPVQLSGGQRQRAAIVQQLLCSDHFIVMDEPFSGLDLLALETVSEVITKVANLDELNTIIIITHDVTAASAVSDHIWMLGRERDPEGNFIPGARIVKTYDLIDRGLCYQPGIITQKPFTDFVAEVKQEFRNL